jgi:hypothetical protein
MLMSLWHRLRKSAPISSQGKNLPKSRRPRFRPKLEALEDRALPAPLVYGIALEGAVAAVSALPPPKPIAIPSSTDSGGLQPIASQPGGAIAHQTTMTVSENSSESVINLGTIFAQTSGIQAEDGLQLSLLGNTNPGLVTPELSGGELTLTYTRSHYGTATITVGATEADGSCVRENIAVTVLPLPATNLGASSPTPAGQQSSITSNTSRAA